MSSKGGFGKGSRHSPETRQRISDAVRAQHARRRAKARLRPKHLAAYQAAGVVAEPLRPLVRIATEETEELIHALGVTGQRATFFPSIS